MSTHIRIGGVLVVGVLIVLGAFFVSQKQAPEAATGTLVAVAPEREYIPPADSDGDGILDWEETLTARVNDAIKLPTQGRSTSTEPYEKPTTFTGKFAEALFADYIAGKRETGTFENPDALVKEAMQTITMEGEKSERYTIDDIVVIPDSPEALRTYGNDLVQIIQRHPVDTKTYQSELEIVKSALESRASDELEKLSFSKTVYTDMLNDTRMLPVPTSLKEEHLALVTAYSDIHQDIAAMQTVFEDPLFALVRLQRYENDVRTSYELFQKIGKRLKEQGVVYTKDEPGVLFNIIAP